MGNAEGPAKLADRNLRGTNLHSSVVFPSQISVVSVWEQDGKLKFGGLAR